MARRRHELAFDRGGIRLYHGGALSALHALPSRSVHALVTDPPAGIAFMGKTWDRGSAFINRLRQIFEEVLRVLMPGGHGLVWALPRTSHWTALALEEAGFEIRDCITHVFGSGFPKSLNVSKALDAAAGAERPVVGSRVLTGNAALSTAEKGGTYGVQVGTAPAKTIDVTAAATELAKQWEGWGTALKPASEHWWLVRKPLEGTVASNVTTHGVGALNIDGCRVGSTKRTPGSVSTVGTCYKLDGAGQSLSDSGHDPNVGRWPANFLLTHSADCKKIGTRRVASSAPAGKPCGDADRARGVYGEGDDASFRGNGSRVDHVDPDGTEMIDVFECAEDCPIRELDRQSGELQTHGGDMRVEHTGMGYGGGNGAARSLPPNSGGASRFFHRFEWDQDSIDAELAIQRIIYAAKPSTSEREEGLDTLARTKVNDGRQTPIDNPFQRGETLRKNTHPTVKGQQLMRHLVRLVTPPGGIVLDPFGGSGSTAVAARTEGMQCILIEREAEYVEIAKGRLVNATRQVTLFESADDRAREMGG